MVNLQKSIYLKNQPHLLGYFMYRLTFWDLTFSPSIFPKWEHLKGDPLSYAPALRREETNLSNICEHPH